MNSGFAYENRKFTLRNLKVFPGSNYMLSPINNTFSCAQCVFLIACFGCRPLAYSTLADLVHHVRQHLPLNDLSLAVQLFAKNIDDESLPSSIQTMSCKLLLNLVDCIRSKSEQENGNGRDILMRMLEVLICLKHLIIAWISCFVVCCQLHFTFSFLQKREYVVCILYFTLMLQRRAL